MKNYQLIPGSFRDPSGFLFYRNGSIYRSVNISYKENYDHLMNSGLYSTLIKNNLLVPHKECLKNIFTCLHNTYKTIKPDIIPFISYPYEWCFSQLKHSAMTTLKIQKISRKFGMSLKDSSAYNIQFIRGKPIFIDTLSFEKYIEGKPWVAYRQFCQHFFAPLVLMCFKNIKLNLMSRLYIDGVSLNLASSLLPFRSYFHIPTLIHIHLHAISQNYFSGKSSKKPTRRLNSNSFIGIINNLESAVNKLSYKITDSEWSDYYNRNNNYQPESFSHKREIVNDYLNKVKQKTAWDLGANLGIFSRIASNHDIYTISCDSDPVVVEMNYRNCLEEKIENILPLVIDLTNPSPNIGWANEERSGLINRGPCEVVLALALIHHLAIGNNLPFLQFAKFLSKICNFLIIEYIPKDDSQAHKLLLRREDIFETYSKDNFEAEFKEYFQIIAIKKIKKSKREMYLMKKIK